MLFTELRFLVFFAIVYLVHWVLRGNTARKVWLLASSYVFYAGWDWRFLGLILLSTIVDYVAGLKLGSTKTQAARRFWMVTSLVVNLGLLGFFKYFNFFVESAVELSSWLGVPLSATTLQITLPVGISFYTFQTLSYTIDVYRKKLEPVRSATDFALFVAFFPQLVAGPIVRASRFLPQLVDRRVFGKIDYRFCLTLFLYGYVKKACMADNFALVVDPVFADPASYTVGIKWLATFMNCVQIYCDFSGYSDMAIATAGLFGYRLGRNFDFPYLASSITGFWQRWHISLATWFRDYLFIPLGGSRCSEARTLFNLTMVFFLCGLWHGAKWNLILWGLLQGLFLIAERKLVRNPEDKFHPLGNLYALAVTVVSMVMFRAQDLTASIAFEQDLFGFGDPVVAPVAISHWWWLAIGAFAVAHVALSRNWIDRALVRLPAPAFSLGYGCALAVVLPWAAADYQPFIYFQF